MGLGAELHLGVRGWGPGTGWLVVCPCPRVLLADVRVVVVVVCTLLGFVISCVLWSEGEKMFQGVSLKAGGLTQTALRDRGNAVSASR